MHLSWIDVALIIGYMSVLIAIGILYKRRASKSIEDYFLGGRQMPWWLLGLAGMAAWLDMTGTMVITSFLYLLGPRGLYIEFRGGAGLPLLIMMLWVGKWHRRSGVVTGAEWMIYRFGSGKYGTFARLASVISIIIMTVGMLAYTFKGAGLFLSMFFPFSPLVCTLGMVAITVIYAIEAGFYGIVIADIMQSIFIIIATTIIIALSVSKVIGTDSLATVATAVTGNVDWTTTLPKWQTTMPAGYENYSLITMVCLFYLAKAMIQGAGAGADPKYFGARSDRDCGLLSFTAGWFLMLRWPLMLGFAVLGLFLVKDIFPDHNALTQASALIKQYIPDVTKNRWAEVTASIMNHPTGYPSTLIDGLRNTIGDDWAKKLTLVSFEGTVEPERILPGVLLFSLPSGLRGLVMVALIGAAVSVFNTFLNTATGYLTRDLYQGYIRPKAGNRELIYASYSFGILMVATGLIMAYSTDSINDIWGWLTMALVSGMAVPTVLRLYWWRFNGGGFAIGTIVGLLAAVGQRIFWPHMPEWQQFIYITTVGLVASIIGTYITEPTDRQILEHFYRTTRPFGLWGPLKHTLSADARRQMRSEHFYDILSLPFSLAWLITLLLIPMQLIIGAYRDCLYTSFVFAASLVGLYLFWYRKLPPNVQPEKAVSATTSAFVSINDNAVKSKA